MTDSTFPTDPALEHLIASARRVRQQGDHVGARALLHAITARYPNELRAWLLLATVAGNRAEQQQAFERVLAIDPSNSLAQRGLAGMRAVAPAEPEPVLQPASHSPAVALRGELPPEAAAVPAQPIRWPLYALLGVAFVILGAGAFILHPQSQTTNIPLAAVGATVASPLPSVGAQIVATVPAAPTLPSAPTPTVAEPTVAPLIVTEATSAPLATVEARAQPVQASTFGQIASDGVWNVGLMRPQDAAILSGSIGELQPQGRFVLALVAIANGANGVRQLPPNLLTLVDASGQRYSPLPAASSAYLQAYGANQAGIVSMESPISPNSGIVSVPVIFDVPATAQGLRLVVGANSDGWQIGG